MAKFNPDFWELTISNMSWNKFSDKDGLYYKDPDEKEDINKRRKYVENIWPEVEKIMKQVLTEQKLKIVNLYYFEEMNQSQIAEKLNISQQAVSEHLYGKIRNGRTIGGAIRKLRKECLKKGITINGIMVL